MKRRTLAAPAITIALVVTGCGDDDGKFDSPNPGIDHEDAVAMADAVVFAETISITDVEDDPDLVTIKPVATFRGQIPVDSEGEYTFEAPLRMSDWQRGFWLFGPDDQPLAMAPDEPQITAYPWPSQHRWAVFGPHPAEVRAADVLADSAIVVMGEIPRGTFERGDETITIDVVRVLQGDPGPSRHLVVGVGTAEVSDNGSNCVFLVDETPAGDFVLHETWISMPWAWDEPALGDALEAAFPDVVPPRPYDC